MGRTSYSSLYLFAFSSFSTIEPIWARFCRVISGKDHPILILFQNTFSSSGTDFILLVLRGSNPACLPLSIFPFQFFVFGGLVHKNACILVPSEHIFLIPSENILVLSEHLFSKVRIKLSVKIKNLKVRKDAEDSHYFLQKLSKVHLKICYGCTLLKICQGC